MRELTISEMGVVGGGLDAGVQVTIGVATVAGGAYAAVGAAAVGAIAGAGIGILGVGLGTLIVADVLFNNGKLVQQLQDELDGDE